MHLLAGCVYAHNIFYSIVPYGHTSLFRPTRSSVQGCNYLYIISKYLKMQLVHKSMHIQLYRFRHGQFHSYAEAHGKHDVLPFLDKHTQYLYCTIVGACTYPPDTGRRE